MSGRHGQRQDFPWWLCGLGMIGLFLLWNILAEPHYRAALLMLSKGIGITLMVTLVAFSAAVVLGLGLAMLLMSRQLWARQIARAWVEVMRGIPIMVLLLWVAFAMVPALVAGLNWLLAPFGAGPLLTRDFPLIWRAILALVLAYSAFLAEIFRAGIEGVDQGQSEAALALGLSPFQRFRLVVLPQALRLILPPLGNDFIAMLKDSSLVAVLGVTDIAQLAKVAASTNFRYIETYNVAALLYLSMTIGLSLLLGRLERRLKQGRRGGAAPAGLADRLPRDI
ncbi:amino acid ABC transporter permease [Pseudogemmobacter faecipullorum]|uniref:amino acid ABC transporter permease n=1 Tax=Pseudogemmobacter faecipullorum TaxID=2755041 RepID=UPI001D0176A1